MGEGGGGRWGRGEERRRTGKGGRKEQSRANTARAAQPAPALSSRDLSPNSREILGRGNKEREGGGARWKAVLCAVASVRAIWGKKAGEAVA